MDFGEVLTKAWKIIWKYKVLWIFGIFASCSSGGGNGGGGGGGGSGTQYSGDLPPSAYHTINNIDPWVWVLIVAGVILLGIIITVIVMAVSTVGRIGLIQGTKLADEDEDAQLTFGGLFNSMKPYFWRILGLNLLIGIAFFVVIMAMVFMIIFAAIFTLGLATICLIPLICLMIPVFWVLTTFIEMANVAVVVEDLSITDGIKRGWEVFKDNLGNMILMGLVLVIGGFIVGMIVALPLILTIIPLMISAFAFAFGDTNAFAGAGVVIAGLCCVAYLPVLLVISGIIRSYIGSAWTLTYLRLTNGSVALETADLLPAEPDEIETQPEIIDEVETQPKVESEPEPEKPPESEDQLPKDF